MANVTLFGSIVSAPVLFFLPFPAEETWLLLGVSIVLHTAYHLFLPTAYRYGDLGQVYPIARGVAPVLVLIGAFFAAGERVPPSTMIGILCLVAGVAALAFDGHGKAAPSRRAIVFAFLTGATIATFTVIDGLGARLSGNALSFAAWMTFGDGLLTYVLIWAWKGRNVPASWRHNFGPLFAGGAMQVATYWIIVVAMTLAPMATVSALRETSVLFAALLSTFLLKEGFSVWRFFSAGLVTAGLVLMRSNKQG
jgi:drug/metabolite transporter (DMT)-like permease